MNVSVAKRSCVVLLPLFVTMTIGFLISPTASAHQKDALNCSDFATQRGAQAIFEPRAPLAPEDPFNLDRNGNGIACETLSDSSLAEDGTRIGAETDNDKDCIDFPHQKAAQAHLRANPSDPNNLDIDNDGIACQIVPVAYQNAPVDTDPVVEAQSNAVLTCDDFEYYQEAQTVYFLDETDPNNLDPDGDGIVCDTLPVLASNVVETEAEVDKSSSNSVALVSAAPLAQNAPLYFRFAGLLLISLGVLALCGVKRWHHSSSSD